MTSYVSAHLRHHVVARANRLCEYCLIHEDDTYLGCHIEHIIAEKHGGPTNKNNLALACVACNRAKGSDIGSIAPSTGEFTRFFNPRTDRWSEHFQHNGIAIEPLTPIGEVTAIILAYNQAERILERQSLAAIDRYPSREAIRILARFGG